MDDGSECNVDDKFWWFVMLCNVAYSTDADRVIDGNTYVAVGDPLVPSLMASALPSLSLQALEYR